MALELFIRSNKKNVLLPNTVCIFFTGEFSSFLLPSIAEDWKGCCPIQEQYSGISKHFTASFLLKFLYNSVSFLFLFYHFDCTLIRCWIAWTLHKSPLTALYSAAWFFQLYSISRTASSIEVLRILSCLIILWVLNFVTYFYLLLPCELCMLVTSCPSFLVLLLLGNFLYLSSWFNGDFLHFFWPEEVWWSFILIQPLWCWTYLTLHSECCSSTHF